MLPDVLQFRAYRGAEVGVEAFFDHGLFRDIAKVGRQHFESEFIVSALW
jgi:hypothetical protein